MHTVMVQYGRYSEELSNFIKCVKILKAWHFFNLTYANRDDTNEKSGKVEIY